MTEIEYNKALKELDVVLLDVDYKKFNSVVDVAKFVIQLNKINENILARESEQIKKEYKQTEKEYAELKIKNHDYAIWATDKIAELEKENAELKEVHESDKNSFKLIIENHKKEIEKMKSNVKDIMNDCNSEDVYYWLQDLLDRWELGE